MRKKQRWFKATHIEQVHEIRFNAFRRKTKKIFLREKASLLAGEFKIEISFKPNHKQIDANIISSEITEDVLNITKAILKDKLKDAFDFPELQIEFVK